MYLKSLVVVSCCLVSFSCAMRKTVAVPSAPSIPHTRIISIEVVGTTGKAPLATIVVLSDDFGHWSHCPIQGSQAVCTVTGVFFIGVQGYITAVADGYEPYRGAFYATGGSQRLTPITLRPILPLGFLKG